MEQIGTLVKDFERTRNVTNHVTQNAFNKEKANHVNMTCTYETIPKRDYGILLRKMESWNITAPKAIIKKFGVFIVKRAVAYTEATPNVRNKAGYMTYMCDQFKKDATSEEISAVQKENQIVEVNKKVEQNPAPQSPTASVKSKKGIFTPPNIINWQQARNFLASLTDNDLEDEDIVIFANKLKKTYNFA